MTTAVFLLDYYSHLQISNRLLLVHSEHGGCQTQLVCNKQWLRTKLQQPFTQRTCDDVDLSSDCDEVAYHNDSNYSDPTNYSNTPPLSPGKMSCILNIRTPTFK